MANIQRRVRHCVAWGKVIQDEEATIEVVVLQADHSQGQIVEPDACLYPLASRTEDPTGASWLHPAARSALIIICSFSHKRSPIFREWSTPDATRPLSSGFVQIRVSERSFHSRSCDEFRKWPIPRSAQRACCMFQTSIHPTAETTSLTSAIIAMASLIVRVMSVVYVFASPLRHVSFSGQLPFS
jgi:hypothetical protein